MQELFVLVPSPLGEPDSWKAVAAELGSRGLEVANLPARPRRERSRAALEPAGGERGVGAGPSPASRGLLLVGHSGATAILPAAGERLVGRVAGYVLVDGPYPRAGRSQLEMMLVAMPGLAAVVERTLAAGDRFPDTRAQQRSNEQAGTTVTGNPRGRRFFEEPVRVPPGWPDAPCGYLALGVKGRTSREIASDLVLSPRTVEMHVHHILVKLDPGRSWSSLGGPRTSRCSAEPLPSSGRSTPADDRRQVRVLVAVPHRVQALRVRSDAGRGHRGCRSPGLRTSSRAPRPPPRGGHRGAHRAPPIQHGGSTSSPARWRGSSAPPTVRSNASRGCPHMDPPAGAGRMVLWRFPRFSR